MIIEEIDWRPPCDAFAPLERLPWANFLHPGELAGAAVWSVIAAFPTTTIEQTADGVLINGEPQEGVVFDAVTKVVDARKRAWDGSPLPMCSGLVGYVGYEMGASLEPTLELPDAPFGLPRLAFGVYDAVALFDRRWQKAYIAGLDREKCDRLKDALGGERTPRVFNELAWKITSNFSRSAYIDAVAGTVEDIKDGRIFQANLAQQLSAQADEGVSALDLFSRIAQSSDARFGALLQLGRKAVISNSPERFFCIEAGETTRKIRVEPIKGTRPRQASPNADAALARELLSDPKERSENLMIADLMRNDLSKICEDDTICEDALCALMSLTRIHHLVSRISGDLLPNVGIKEVFRALFPSGSVTGAPKIESMKLISEMEKVGRGPYCGAIGYIDDRGGADFSVGIRTAVLEKMDEGAKLTFPVGGGITLRSQPEAEYEETLVKSRDFLAGLGRSWEAGS